MDIVTYMVARAVREAGGNHRGFNPIPLTGAVPTALRVAGTGRHADSLGNRELFPAPGMQWMSVGSGVEHAEGGGTPPGPCPAPSRRSGTPPTATSGWFAPVLWTPSPGAAPAGETEHGFQIWINVPADRKKDAQGAGRPSTQGSRTILQRVHCWRFY